MHAALRPQFLILGGSGFLGRELYRLLGPQRAVATFNSTPIPGGVHFDASRARLAQSVLRNAHGFEAAFVLYGITNIDACARAPEATHRINVESVVRTIDDLLAAGIKPIYASSDAVFDGSPGERTEDAAANPILTYGKQKAAVEAYLSRQSGPSIVARLSKLIGRDPDDSGLLGEWIGNIERGEAIHCATDQYFAPIDVADAARALIRLADPSLSGLYNVCGPRSMSRLELLRILVREIRRYRKVEPNVVECRLGQIAFVEPRPPDCSMSSTKLQALLDAPLHDMESVCADLARRRYGAA